MSIISDDTDNILTPQAKILKELGFRMYDVDGNGTIEPEEMSRIVHSIYAMMGPDRVKRKVTWLL